MAPGIPETMKAALVEKHKAPMVIRDVAVPKVNPDEVLVKIVASGICHSDMHIGDGEMPAMNRTPIILGHEGVGVVVKLGSNVRHLKVGERVAIGNVNSACNACVDCHEGRENHCKKYVQTGGAVDGCYAQYQKIDAAYAIKIPDGLKFADAAPICCAGATIYGAIKPIKADQKPGTWVAVIGVGGLGHLAIQYLTAVGFQVIAIDVAADKLELATKLGAKRSFDARDPKLASQVMRFTEGGCSGVMVTAVHESAFATSIKIARANATVVWISLPPNPIQILPKVVVFKALRIIGAIVGTRSDLTEAFRLMAAGKVQPIIEHVGPLEQVNAAWDRMRKGTALGRMVMTVDENLIDLTTSAPVGKL